MLDLAWLDEHVTLIGVVGLVVLLACALDLALVPPARPRRHLLTVVLPAALGGLGLAFALQTATTPVHGANVGGGLMVLGLPVLALPVAAAATGVLVGSARDDPADRRSAATGARPAGWCVPTAVLVVAVVGSIGWALHRDAERWDELERHARGWDLPESWERLATHRAGSGVCLTSCDDPRVVAVHATTDAPAAACARFDDPALRWLSSLDPATDRPPVDRCTRDRAGPPGPRRVVSTSVAAFGPTVPAGELPEVLTPFAGARGDRTLVVATSTSSLD